MEWFQDMIGMPWQNKSFLQKIYKLYIFKTICKEFTVWFLFLKKFPEII